MSTRHHRKSSSASDCTKIKSPSWIKAISEPLDHAHGLVWSTSVIPNNFFFFTRSAPHEMKPHSISAHLHDTYELVVSYEGEGKVCIDQTVYPVKPGTAFLIRPHEFHLYFGYKTQSFLWLIFKFELTDKLGLVPEHGPCRHLDAEGLARLSEEGARYAYPMEDHGQIFKIASFMGEFIHGMKHLPVIEPDGTLADADFSSYAILYSVARYVYDRIDDLPRINDLAKHLGVSESNLRKLFRECTGISLGRYLSACRSSRSVYLVAHTDLSMAEIARQSGFETTSSFGLAFRKSFGMSPSNYRKHLQAGGISFKH